MLKVDKLAQKYGLTTEYISYVQKLILELALHSTLVNQPYDVLERLIVRLIATNNHWISVYISGGELSLITLRPGYLPSGKHFADTLYILTSRNDLRELLLELNLPEFNYSELEIYVTHDEYPMISVLLDDIPYAQEALIPSNELPKQLGIGEYNASNYVLIRVWWD